MADISVGNIVASLKIDTSQLAQGMQAAQQAFAQFASQTQSVQQALRQLGQTKDGLIGNFGQLQQAVTRNTQQFQQFTQVNQQLNQQFTQFNTTLNQTNQTFHTVTTNATQFNTTLNQTTVIINQARQAGQGLGSVWSQIFQIAGGIGLANSLQSLLGMIKDVVVASIQLSGRMEDLQRSFTALEGSGGAATRTLAGLFETAQRTGVNFLTLAEGFRRLEAGAKGTTLSQEDLKRSFEGIVQGARVMGLSTQQVESALIAFEQILTKGRLSAEELVRQLGNAVPGGLEKVASALGITTGELRSMAEAGVIPGTVAFTAFGVAMRQVGESGGPIEGFTSSLARLTNEWTKTQKAIGDTVNTSLVPLLNILTKILEVWNKIAAIKGPFVTQELNRGEPNMQGTVPGQGGMGIAPSRFTAQIMAAAQGSGVDVGLLSQLVRVESRFDPNAVSSAGALGLGQLMPDTARLLQPGITREQILEPQRNLQLAAQYLKQQLDHFKAFDDQVRLALAAYHSGPSTIDRLLAEAQRRGLPQTFEGITHIPPSAGGLGPAGRAYPGLVMANVQTATPAAGATNEITQQFLKQLVEANEQFDRLAERARALAASTANYGGFLNKDVSNQLQGIVDIYARIQTYIAAFPEQAKAFGTGIQQEIQERTREAVILQQALMSEEGRRDLLKQQVEQLEQLAIHQQAQVKAQQEGQAEAARYTREATTALQEQRLADKTRLAGMTLGQQITEYTARWADLNTQVQLFGNQLERLQAEKLLPQLQARLGQIQTLFAMPGLSDAEQARQRVVQQGVEARRALMDMLREIQQHPAIAQLAPELLEQLESAFTQLPEFVAAQSEKAFEAMARKMRDALDDVQGQIEQIGLRLGTVALNETQSALQRIQREGVETANQVRNAIQALEERRPRADLADQARIIALIAQLRDLEAQIPAATEQRALDALGAPARGTLEDMQRQLEQGEAARQGRLGTGLEYRYGAQGATLTDDEARQHTQLLEQLKAQERLNYYMGLFEDLANSVGSAWMSALNGIADGTKTVSAAFKEMARSILQSMAQIASQEAFKALIRIGFGLLGAAFGSSAAIGGGTTSLAATGGSSGFLAGSGSGGLASLVSGGSSSAVVPAFQHGGYVTKPTLSLLGEGGPEYVIPAQRMQAMQAQMRAGGRSGDAGSGVSVFVVDNRQQAERDAVRERAMGREVIIREVVSEMGRGESSQILGMVRRTQR